MILNATGIVFQCHVRDGSEGTIGDENKNVGCLRSRQHPADQ